MREIKFRVFNTITKKMWEWNEMKNGCFSIHYRSPRDIWMQFTGLLDKNGKEIFEGDILKGRKTGCDVRLFTVSWGRDIAGFIPFASYDTDCDQYFEIETCEVIGNIYENPELLNK